MSGFADAVKWNSYFPIKTAILTVLFFVTYITISWASSTFDEGLDAVLGPLPVVLGILCGYAASIAIIIAGALIAPMMTSDPVFAILYILSYSAISLCSYRCFRSIKKAYSNDYVYDSRGLLSFFVTVIVMIIELYCASEFIFIGDNSQYLSSSSIMVFNAIWVSLVFGMIVLIAVSFFYHAPSMPCREQSGRWRYFLYLLLLFPPIMVIFLDGIDDSIKYYIGIIDIIIFAVIGIFGPSKPIVYKENEFRSIKYRTFVMIIISAIALSLIIDLVFELMAFKADSDIGRARETLFFFRAITVSAIMAAFIFVAYIIERRVTAPIYDITNRIRRDNETENNEFDVISNRLDFIAGNKDDINGNEFALYIGLTKRDGSAQYSVDDAKKTIDGICLRYVGGYISSHEGKGGYKGSDQSVSEDVLVYKIFGASDEQINNILDDILKELDQESVLVEKNGISRWYYYGRSKD